MGLRDRFRAFFGYDRYFVIETENDADYYAADLDYYHLYKTQANLQAVITFIADNVAQLPAKVYRRSSDTDRVRVTDSPAAKLFSGAVNPYMTRYEYVRAVVSNLLLYGRNHDLIIVDPSAPSGFQLRPIPPLWIVKTHGSSYSDDSIDVRLPGDAGKFNVVADDYVAYYTYNPSAPNKCLSPVSALRDILGEQIEAQRYRSSVWRRGGRTSAYIARPKDVEPFTKDQKAKFVESFKAAWTGDYATNGGGVILLEDGMELKSFQINPHEAQWSEAKQFSREDIAAIYHINPKLIWAGDGQTYASAKDNARALYADALAPIVQQIESRINTFLLPKLGEPDGNYLEFDIAGKLRGSFEEQADVLYKAVGGPYMSVNEARARMNLPSLGSEFDSILVPLNTQLVSGEEKQPVQELSIAPMSRRSREQLEFKAEPSDARVVELKDVFAKFYERQKAAIIPKIGAKAEWWNAERWDKELADDLNALALATTSDGIKAALTALAYDFDVEPDGYAVLEILLKMAGAINEVTYKRILAALESDGDGVLDTVSGVFDNAIEERAESNALSLTTHLTSYGALYAAAYAAGRTNEQVLKTWVHAPSKNPRSEHLRMDGETVPFDEPFSNGADFPGDINALDVADVCNCHCSVLITRP